MKFSEYQKLAARTHVDSIPDLTDTELMVLWDAVGLAGESGETLDLVKKIVFHRHPFDKTKLKKEVGDCLWYLACLATTLGLDLDEVANENIEKLKIRYPDGFSTDRSIRRVDVE